MNHIFIILNENHKNHGIMENVILRISVPRNLDIPGETSVFLRCTLFCQNAHSIEKLEIIEFEISYWRSFTKPRNLFEDCSCWRMHLSCDSEIDPQGEASGGNVCTAALPQTLAKSKVALIVVKKMFLSALNASMSFRYLS